MKKFKSLFILSVISVIFALNANRVSASEGYIELTNTVNEASRCYIFSVLMEDGTYRALTSCRDISYPGGTEVFNYIVWANPVSGGNPIKLGTLGLGKVEFESEVAYTSLFVTKQQDGKKVNSPAGQVVMQGSVQKVGILENPSQAKFDRELDEVEPTATPIPQKKTSSLNIFRLGGVLAFVGLVGAIVLVFVITKK
ncbi:hypothetical protein A2382_02175 [Candidatus Woesebacteria bacterium RIFOXYB1_FULL_38_16]|uniref:Uncharacterized protein n=1 Tax=Candidatus Woesebacteria bacterium RIFOXYB1_FULL_38_16 TaxID=1802538 RepID=A0A1F8CTP9_9BACT|nr:MAG: hypothetical protein A2191_02540 [Candidatus Woesebacteria bacterium RIFOXYA1_FULL_38_9]OGM79704.1 MAG: hypothetical protein A2382_02175 [Candidatus Woesebacteria bacterium RIFOXYB1_FULL_38_16]